MSPMNRAGTYDFSDHSHCQNVFIAHLSTNPPDSGTLFTVNGHVLMMHLLVLRWSCERCGRQECICPSTSHDGFKQGQVSVQTKFSVDDGTGEAMVWCHDVRSVSNLLGLRPALWNQLIELLPSYGKVVYRYSKEEHSQQQDAAQLPQLNDDLESVVSMLCTHNSIQQPVKMKCRMLHSNQPMKHAASGNTKFGSSEHEQSGDARKKYIPWQHLKCTEIITFQ
ncbi:CST complex subunit CTC1-like [Amphiura filiformis]|uniref:CST complex subunit CTC1-like n=1 Tax=Amphiura filiformis TaxID=82378 RepID=UPI003B218032